MEIISSFVNTFLFSSSCTVYGNKKKIFKENSKKFPISYYGKTKLKCENLIKIVDFQFHNP